MGKVEKMLLGERHIRIFKQLNIDPTLDLLDNFMRTIEGQLKDLQEKYETTANEKRSKLDKQERDEFLEIYREESWILENQFPHMFRFSFFITCYAYLESELIRICRLIEGRHDYPKRLSDLAHKHKGIKLAQTYLKEVAGINFPDQTSNWNDIRYYGLIRNELVHNAGNLDEKSKNAEKIEVYIKNHPQLLKLGHWREIQFTSNKFLPEVVHTLRLFFNDFFEVWMAWARNVNAH